MIADGGAEQDGGVPDHTENERHRSVALDFVKGLPCIVVVIIRLILEPLRMLMQSKLYVSSARWEKRQKAQAATASAASGGTSAPWHGRELRLSVAAGNALERICFERLGRIDNPVMFTAVPLEHRTEKTAALAFVMVGRSGCLVQELLVYPHTCWPHRFFGILHDDSVAQELEDARPCTMDAATERFRTKFSGALDTFVAKLYIYVVSLLGYSDIAHVEALHAIIRRLIKRRVQTHGLSMADASAGWLLGRQRSRMPRCISKKQQRRSRRMQKELGKRQPGSAQSHMGAQPTRPRKPPSGGAWRLFCRKQSTGRTGQFTSWAAAAVKYRMFSPQDKAELKKEAWILKARQMTSGCPHALGEKRSAVVHRAREVAQRQRLEEAVDPDQSDHEQQTNLALSHLTHTQGSISLEKLKKVATKAERWNRGAQGRGEKEDERVLEEWRDNSSGLFKEVLEAVPSVKDLIQHAQIAPGSNESCLVAEVDCQWRGDLAGQLAGILSDKVRKTNLKRVLEDDLVLRTALVRDDSSPDPPHHVQPDSWSCRALGVCICPEGPNPQLSQFRKRWYAAMKLQFPFSAKDRKEVLKASKVVVEFVGVRMDDDVEVLQKKVFHISLMY